MESIERTTMHLSSWEDWTNAELEGFDYGFYSWGGETFLENAYTRSGETSVSLEGDALAHARLHFSPRNIDSFESEQARHWFARALEGDGRRVPRAMRYSRDECMMVALDYAGLEV